MSNTINLSVSQRVNRRAVDGKDGNSLNVKGKIVKHYKNWASFKKDATEHLDEEDPYIELSDGTKAYMNSLFIFDTTSDYSEEHDEDTQTGFNAPTVMQFINGIYVYDPIQPTLNDAYMDNDGNLWVAGTKAWTNVGAIKGEKGDKGDKGDAGEWYEVITGNTPIPPQQEISSIATDYDGNMKTTTFFVGVMKHTGSDRSLLPFPSFSVETDESTIVVERLSQQLPAYACTGSKLTTNQVTVTVKVGTTTVSKTLPVVKDGESGDNGKDATEIILSPDEITFETDDDGNITGGSQTCTLKVKQGTTTLMCVNSGTTLEEGKNYYLDTAYPDIKNISSDGVKEQISTDKNAEIIIIPAKITTYTKDDITIPYTEGYVDIKVHLANDVELIKRIVWHVNFAKYIGKVAWDSKSLDASFNSYKSTTDGTIATMQSNISANASSISACVKQDGVARAGLTLNEDGVVLEGDKIEVKNDGETSALFNNGMLNANLINVSKLSTSGSNSAKVVIENGLLSVFGTNGVCNIKFGVNENGLAVLSYYDAEGKWLYDLGPNGLDAKITQEAKVEEDVLVDMLTMLNVDSIDDIGTIQTSGEAQGFRLVNRQYALGLFGPEIAEKTPEGYKPENTVKKTLYKYSCGRLSGTPIKDNDRGLTTAALAETADGKWFNQTPFGASGTLTNLSNGVYMIPMTSVVSTWLPDMFRLPLVMIENGVRYSTDIYYIQDY